MLNAIEGIVFAIMGVVISGTALVEGDNMTSVVIGGLLLIAGILHIIVDTMKNGK